MVELNSICNVSSGDSAPQDDLAFENGEIPFVRMKDLGRYHLTTNLIDTDDLLNRNYVKEKGLTIYPKGSILIPKSGSVYLNHRAILGDNAVVVGHIAVLSEYKPEILHKYLYYVLCKIDIGKMASKTSGLDAISLSLLKQIKVLLPSLPIQQQIVDEIDSYQKIIDGAKQVVDNYKPQIKIDPSWKIVELGEISEVVSGQSPDGKFYNKNQIGLPFYQGKSEFTDMYVGNPTNWTTQTTKIAENGDILMSVRAPVGPVNIAIHKICIGRGLAAIRPNTRAEMTYLFYYLKSIENTIKGGGGSVFDSISRDQIQQIKISLPSLETQKQIVVKIEEEQKLVEANKKLIQLFEQKIKDRVEEVWGN